MDEGVSINKYHVAAKEDRTWNNIVFQSRHEMLEYIPFTILEKSGIIYDLKRQVPYDLIVNGKLTGHYIADWTCIDADGRLSVYDAKGYRDKYYKFKKKVWEACYPSLRIIEL